MEQKRNRNSKLVNIIFMFRNRDYQGHKRFQLTILFKRQQKRENYIEISLLNVLVETSISRHHAESN